MYSGTVTKLHNCFCFVAHVIFLHMVPFVGTYMNEQFLQNICLKDWVTIWIFFWGLKNEISAFPTCASGSKLFFKDSFLALLRALIECVLVQAFCWMLIQIRGVGSLLKTWKHVQILKLVPKATAEFFPGLLSLSLVGFLHVITYLWTEGKSA